MNKIYLILLINLLIQAITAQDKPNILWLTSEDNNVTYIGCYGNKMAVTPNIDKLATEGFRYLHCYSNGAVCSASRSTWIAGMNAVSMGTQNHRSKYNVPNSVKLYPQVLKAAGYYTGNSTKQDYSMTHSGVKGMWNNPGKVKWDDLPKNQPFFQVINSTASHESKAFGTTHTHDSAKVKVAPYHPDIPGIRDNYAHYYDAITKMDSEIGASLAKLEELGLAENTIVIYNSDHGGALPRGKRFMYNSGTHCPLVIRIPKKFKHLWPAEKPGTTVDRLVSFVDMPATWLSLCGTKIPSQYQGKVFLGKNADPEGKYHFSFRGRNDARVENARAVRDKRFLYVKNYIPYVPRGQYLSYQWRIPMQVMWEEHHRAGKTDSITGRFFEEKPLEEFYDTSKDPYNTNNLINNPEYSQIVETMRKELKSRQKEYFDAGLLPESDMVKRAADNNMTIYEMVHNSKLYNTSLYMNAADTALAKDVSNLPELIKMLEHDDSAVRYWAAVGCFMLNKEASSAQNALKKALNDKGSDNVKLMAAWALIKMGDSDKGDSAINKLLQENTYATLEVLNVIAWMGDYGKRFIPAVAKIKAEHEMKNQIVHGREGALKMMKKGKGKSKNKKKPKK